jgi:hypothetical protein
MRLLAAPKVLASTATARSGAWTLSPNAARAAMLLSLGVALAAGFWATDTAQVTQAIEQAGPDLTRLLRFMAALKALMATAAAAALFWRLGVAIAWPWFLTYALAAGAMVAGPGLIWMMAHVTLGALMLHGGLAASILLLWRDPAVAARLAANLAARRRPSR